MPTIKSARPIKYDEEESTTPARVRRIEESGLPMHPSHNEHTTHFYGRPSRDLRLACGTYGSINREFQPFSTEQDGRPTTTTQHTEHTRVLPKKIHEKATKLKRSRDQVSTLLVLVLIQIKKRAIGRTLRACCR